MKYLAIIHLKMMKWEGNLAYLSLFLIVFLVFFAALLRLVGVPQAWMGDLSKILFAWVIFLGSDVAMNVGRHIGVEFFEERLPILWRKRIAQLWSILIVAFLSFITYYGWFLTQKSRREFDSIMVSDFSLAIGFSTFLIFCVAFDYFKSDQKNKKIYLAIISGIILITAYLLITIDFSHTAENISYSYLIASVPIGCILMIRTTFILFIKNWSLKNV
ncbi:Tripartite ATP-independent transporter, DctQ component [Marinomonas polaris DSM 16579]|uniref:TRAP transporter small permease protein n=1 Tax=Marinomonas polaris DSM 16579 TaxID=1122206 RepID=A0A1M5FKB2_9GAMM|nr:TRAP transporter small permease [Marinomonas polaris]SHF91943.1 Tripartite ATP-independent transporter, DctQ component [Marinomonas polaris DSM 16579]